eukprot:gene7452-14248_t
MPRLRALSLHHLVGIDDDADDRAREWVADSVVAAAAASCPGLRWLELGGELVADT